MRIPENAQRRVRSAVVVSRAGKVALIEREREGKRYYLFPGGGVEGSESTKDAAAREALEELGVAVQVERLVAVSNIADRKQYYYLARIVGGEFGSGRGAELASSPDSRKGSYTPV